MTANLSEALNESLAALEEGFTVEECVARYPGCAADLRPLLRTALEVRQVSPPASTSAAFIAGRQRMLRALAEKKRRRASLRARISGWLTDLLGEPRRTTPLLQKRALGLLVAATFVLLTVGGILFYSWLGAAVVRTTTLESVSGRVEILPFGSESWLPISAGEQVEIGDQIRTGPLSTASLVFFDGSTTKLEAETKITIMQASSQRDTSDKVIVIHQWLGQTRNQVRRLSDTASRFEVTTSEAVIAVRGTDFDVSVESDGTTQISVREGLVEVTAQGMSIEVKAGQVADVRPSQPPVLSGVTETPEPPGLTKTPQPPGLTKTPEPPGLTKTPQPPGLTKTPQPPGQEKTKEPPGPPGDKEKPTKSSGGGSGGDPPGKNK